MPRDPDAEDRARAALAALSPTATLVWSEAYGTPGQIDGLAIALTGCTGDDDVLDHALDLVAASPDLFDLDPTEWSPEEPSVRCADITSQETVLGIQRTHYGPRPVEAGAQVFRMSVRREGNVIIWRPLVLLYIPQADPTVLAALDACAAMPEAELRARLLADPFGYVYFYPPDEDTTYCYIEGDGAYPAAEPDRLDFDAGDVLTLAAIDASHASLRRMRHAILTVDPSNYTDELVRSSANCPADGEEARIGWIRWYDPVTGEILAEKASPRLECHVCLTTSPTR